MPKKISGKLQVAILGTKVGTFGTTIGAFYKWATPSIISFEQSITILFASLFLLLLIWFACYKTIF